MAYLIACWRDGTPYGVTASLASNKFELIPLDSDSALSKVFNHPYRVGAQNILSWIKKNDKKLHSQGLSIQDSSRFQR
jgi:hypothetical protein